MRQADTGLSVLPDALSVGSAMGDRICHRVKGVCREVFIDKSAGLEKTSYPTHAANRIWLKARLFRVEPLAKDLRRHRRQSPAAKEFPISSFSIIIPTYNRRTLVSCAIDSALAWLEERPDGEIIVVDDASTDGTFDELSDRYRDAVGEGQIVILCNEQNLGVTGSRNRGGAVARGEWLIWLDSDDVLRASAVEQVLNLLNCSSNPVVFFRCAEADSGRLVGAPQQIAVQVDAATYLRNWRWGECLPCVRRTAFARFPYEAALRGHEGIAYARMFSRLGPAVVSPLIARDYNMSGTDRLSLFSVRRKRAEAMLSGYIMILREFPRELGIRGVLKMSVRVAAYAAASWPRFRKAAKSA